MEFCRDKEDELPLWGSVSININDDTTKQFAIEPFGFELEFDTCRSPTDKEDKLKLTANWLHRFKKDAHIGVCFDISIEFVCNGLDFGCVTSAYIANKDRWYDWKSKGEIGVPCGAGIWNLEGPDDIYKDDHETTFEVRISQILEYPDDIKYIPSKVEESKAKNIIKDQNEIKQFLSPLMYRTDELMNEFKLDNDKIKKENDELKRELEELRQWKIDQINKDEKEENVENEEFNVTEWLREINLEKYGELLIESGYDDLDSILDINKDDLMEIGVKPGHRKKILKAVANLRQEKD